MLKKRNTIRLMMPPPLLVMEVVSPGNLQHERDYIAKRRQYEDIGANEYWIVDPSLRQITVLVVQAGSYEEVGVFKGAQIVKSSTFPELAMAANTVLSAGKS